jgi:hypothetical protein
MASSRCGAVPFLASSAILAAVACSSTTGGGMSTYAPPLGPEDQGDQGIAEPAGAEGEQAEDLGGGSADLSGSGETRLRVKVLMSGEEASGQVRIVSARAERTVVGSGSSRQTFDLEPGEYDVEVTLEDAFDRPEKLVKGVEVLPGRTTVHEVPFVVGTIKLQPMRGRQMVGKEIRWRYSGAGDWFPTTTEAGQEITLSAGRYDAEVTVGRQNITINDIQVYEGKRTVSPEIRMR